MTTSVNIRPQVIYGQRVLYPTKVLYIAEAVPQAAAVSSYSWRLCHRYGQGPAARLPNELAIQIAKRLEEGPAESARRRSSKALRCLHKVCSHYGEDDDLEETVKHKKLCSIAKDLLSEVGHAWALCYQL